jgi:hypothetical protein
MNAFDGGGVSASSDFAETIDGDHLVQDIHPGVAAEIQRGQGSRRFCLGPEEREVQVFIAQDDFGRQFRPVVSQ